MSSIQLHARSLRFVAAGAAAGALLATAGCSSSSTVKAQPPASKPASPSASASTSAATLAATQQILAAYNGYRAEQVKIFATATGDVKERNYVTGSALSADLSALIDYQKAGVVFTGTPTFAPKVTAVDLAAVPPTGTVTDCFNGTGWRPVFKATGQSASSPGQNLRYVVVSTVQEVDGTWKVSQTQLEKDLPC